MEIFEKLVKLLINNNLHISAAESCTGGMFLSEIVSVPDASKVLSAGFVTYSEEAKNKFALVPFDVIEKYGVVSEQTALSMARGAALNATADIGVGITGYAGPGAGDTFAEAGTVFVGLTINKEEKCYKLSYGNTERNEVRRKTVIFAAEKLYSLLKTDN